MRTYPDRPGKLFFALPLLVLLAAAGCGDLLTGDSDSAKNNWAVVVGVSSYRVPSFNLKWADDDALDFFDALVRGNNWEPNDITVLLNGSATKGAIKSAISSIGSRISAEDNFVFFFSGHGTVGPDQPPLDEADGLEEYLVPHDGLSNSHANDISDDELEIWFAALPTNNVCTVLDSSFSGGFIRGRLKPQGKFKFIDRGEILVRSVRRVDGMMRELTRPGYVVLTASAANESPLESNILRNGVFTFYLTEGMLGPANPDGRVISAQQAYEYAAPRATAFYSGQHAQLGDFRGSPYRLVVK